MSRPIVEKRNSKYNAPTVVRTHIRRRRKRKRDRRHSRDTCGPKTSWPSSTDFDTISAVFTAMSGFHVIAAVLLWMVAVLLWPSAYMPVKFEIQSSCTVRGSSVLMATHIYIYRVSPHLKYTTLRTLSFLICGSICLWETVRICACTYACICVYIFVCTYVCTPVRMHAYKRRLLFSSIAWSTFPWLYAILHLSRGIWCHNMIPIYTFPRTSTTHPHANPQTQNTTTTKQESSIDKTFYVLSFLVFLPWPSPHQPQTPKCCCCDRFRRPGGAVRYSVYSGGQFRPSSCKSWA